jgi:hypothetical protein
MVEFQQVIAPCQKSIECPFGITGILQYVGSPNFETPRGHSSYATNKNLIIEVTGTGDCRGVMIVRTNPSSRKHSDIQLGDSVKHILTKFGLNYQTKTHTETSLKRFLS